MSDVITFEIANHDHWPDTHYLCRNKRPIEHSHVQGKLYFYLFWQAHREGRVYYKRDGSVMEEVEITKDEYEWMLAHPEEAYMISCL